MRSTNGDLAARENPTSSFVHNLRKELENLPPLSPDCCIYRVPDRLRRSNEKSYTPQIVSIGPFHHGKESLKRMEEHKKRYLKSFLRQTTVSLEDYVAVVKEREIRIRHCYADSIDLSSEKFVEMILVDAAFVIEFFLRFIDLKFRDDIDQIYQKPLMMRYIVPDLQLLENQLPFFILDDLFETAKKSGFTVHHQMNSMIAISHIFFKWQFLVKKNDEMFKVFSPEVFHFVDLLRNFYLPEESKGEEFKNLTVPTITELHQAGVKLKKGKSTNLFKITFKNGVLTIPTLKLLDRTEILFRNLLAFEHCHCLKTHFTDYFILMERLIEGPEDLKLLVKYGIVEHSMSDSGVTSSLINELTDGVVVDFNNFYFASVCEEMNVYCRTSWHKWKANLKQNYFNTPWADDESAFLYGEETGKGPEKWSQINRQWQACNNGKLQSPIDLLNERVEAFPFLGKLKRDYKPVPATIKNRGHDITVKWKGEAGKITINETDYNLVQCHWHSPSEHTFNGSRYELELHIVHLSARGEIAVIGIVYKYGRPDPFLSRIFDRVKSVEEEETDLGVINPGDIKFGSRKYYRYIGSLTVPPCTEGVVWTIINKVRTVSRQQVRALRDLVHDGFEANARPTQQADGREVLLYTPKEN